MKNSVSVPTRLEELLTLVQKAEGQLPHVRKGSTKAIGALARKLPLLALPERIAFYARKFSEQDKGKRTGDGLELVEEILVNLRMPLERTITHLTTPEKELVPLEGNIAPDAEQRFWFLCSMHHEQCRKLLAATNPHYPSTQDFRKLTGQGTVGGWVEERGDNVASFLVQELRYQEHGDNFIHDIGVHPDVPDAGDSVLQDFIRHSIGKPVRMVVRESREPLMALLARNGFTKMGVVPKLYRDGAETMDGHLMERKPIGPLLQISLE